MEFVKMKYTICMFALCCSQFIFAQNVDSMLQQLVRHDTIYETPKPEYIKDVWDFDTAMREEDSLLLVLDQVEISSMNSNSDHKTYLELIDALDRKIRNIESKVARNFGYNSSKHDSIVTVMETIDRKLLIKVREYLSTHSFPRVDDAGEGSGSIVVKVFHHSADTPENIDLKKMYFPTFYKAYEQGDLYSTSLWFLIFRLYHQLMNEVYVNQELNDEEQIEEMINLLDLDRK